MVDLSVKIGRVTLKNPIMPASGAFSTELAQVMDINRLGALVTKTVSREFRIGNPTPRVAELEGGMINSIGLPGKGLKYFLEHQLPDYKRFTPPVVANITATTADDFAAMARDVTLPEVDAIEMNISCPTRDPKGGNFALHEEHTFNVMRRIRATTDKPIWCKLSPNAGDVVGIAKAAEADGAFALILLDIMLPVFDGVEVARQVRARWPKLPILACSAAFSQDVLARLRAFNVNDYLPKPYPAENLHEMIDRLTAASDPPAPSQTVSLS